MGVQSPAIIVPKDPVGFPSCKLSVFYSSEFDAYFMYFPHY